mmetsp:Transcript_88233/g.234291  ORF Transcript_88233/g.234291 Transcript_88233/m.234291 type:complete len:311 (-) Transcript_88233:292-1224(-)
MGTTRTQMPATSSRGLLAPPLAALVLAAAERLCSASATSGCGFATPGAAPRGAAPPAARLVAATPRVSAPGAAAHGGRQGRLPAAAAAAVLAAAASRSRQHAAGRRLRSTRRAAEEGPSLASSAGICYSALRGALASGDFKAADAETRRLLIEIAGEAARKRGWIYFSEVKGMPEQDMSTIEGLWQHYSQGKFGFVAQRKIWRQCRAEFAPFAEQVSWFTDKWKNRNWPDEFIYDLSAPVGHLPLTNCIRGSQVLEELLDHPAFEKKKAAPEAGAQRSGMSLLASGGARHQTAARGRALAGSSPPSGRRL